MENLRLVSITKDGNCLFRALALGVYGTEELHYQLRCMIVEALRRSREEYEQFFSINEDFNKYCNDMQEDGCWAGYRELCIASRMLGKMFLVHQENYSIIIIQDTRTLPKEKVQLRYSETLKHYDLLADSQGAGESRNFNDILLLNESEHERNKFLEAENTVRQATNCDDAGLIRKIVALYEGDIVRSIIAVKEEHKRRQAQVSLSSPAPVYEEIHIASIEGKNKALRPSFCAGIFPISMTREYNRMRTLYRILTSNKYIGSKHATEKSSVNACFEQLA